MNEKRLKSKRRKVPRLCAFFCTQGPEKNFVSKADQGPAHEREDRSSLLDCTQGGEVYGR